MELKKNGSMVRGIYKAPKMKSLKLIIMVCLQKMRCIGRAIHTQI